MPVTVRELLRAGTERLQRVVRDNPGLAAEYILRHLLGLEKIDLYLEPGREVSAGAEADFWALINRKIKREPLQYVLGETEWLGLKFKCDRRALVPRPETEILTEKAIELLREMAAPLVADIGTGSGNIAIALAQNLPQTKVIATDASEVVLSLAAENVELHGLQERITLRRGNLFAAFAPDERFDLIISNPPYIRVSEYSGLMPEVKDFEPPQALIASEDGLSIIRTIIEEAPKHLKKSGWLIIEFGIDHAEPIKAIAAQTQRYSEPEIIIDYNQQPRGVLLCKS